MSDQIVVEAANYRSEIRTRDSSKQGTADLRFRPHSHRYWQSATQRLAARSLPAPIHFQKWREVGKKFNTGNIPLAETAPKN
jgi:hypothetical protein